MCGIVGYIGPKDPTEVILDGLRRLEYRGYDSAGIAVVEHDGQIAIRRAAGKLRDLEKVVAEKPVKGRYGIGHTRWATHGRPTEENAHPHRDCSGRLVVIHNGIIENYVELKAELQALGHRFVTETDTEIVAHALEEEMRRGGASLEQAFRAVLPRLRGMYALVALCADAPDTLVAARLGPPLVVGIGAGELFVASDIPAILSHTKDVVFLDDNEMVVLTPAGPRFLRPDGVAVTRTPLRVPWDPIMAEKGGYKHFMLKEIHEQPRAVRDTLLGRVSLESGGVFLEEMAIDDETLRSVDRSVIVACGTSWHAGLVGKFLMERFAKLPVGVDYASEYRYRRPIINPRVLPIFISQSGETADTLAALREARLKEAPSLAICNVRGSMLTREATGTILTNAGPEIGVASTKAFTSQIIALALFAIRLGRVRGVLDETEAREFIRHLYHIPVQMERCLADDRLVQEIARTFHEHRDFLYLGRGVNYPIALEGALKLKEISYIHAEGYPAGEMKHGPIALIDESMPVVALAPHDTVFEKMLSNIEEVKARSGIVIVVTDGEDDNLRKRADYTVQVPKSHELLAPLLLVLPLQLLAYHIALLRGCDVDQPRNLAKSVTVE
jgi:glucosamine--fructose-6-phosphate aminotransferase (isomerizing)